MCMCEALPTVYLVRAYDVCVCLIDGLLRGVRSMVKNTLEAVSSGLASARNALPRMFQVLAECPTETRYRGV
jgi:hypothetical protein